MRALSFKLFSIFICLMLATISARANEQDVMVVLDASGSMWGQIEGKPKIEIARSVMEKMLIDLSGKADIGVMTYGHRQKGRCDDIESIIPVGKVDPGAYMAAINKLSPKGKTPITRAVRQSAEELRYTEEKATVILVSDGLETCEADPCALAKELAASGVDFKVHVVGFDLKDKDTASLQCLANETGGKYLAAENADELSSAFETITVDVQEEEAPAEKTVKIEVEETEEPAKPAIDDSPVPLTINVRLSPESEPIRNAYVYVIPEAANKVKSKAASVGSSGKNHRVKPGKYYVEASHAKIVRSAEVDVKAGEDNTVELVLDAGLLSVDAVAEEGGEPLKKAYIRVFEPEPQANGKRKNVTGGNERVIFTLPAGYYYTNATLGKAVAGQEVEIKAGELTEALIVLASGLLKVDVLNEEGGKPQISGAYVYIFESEAGLDGKRKQVTGGNPRNQFDLPAGKYYVEGVVGKARAGREIDVAAGKRADITIIVGAGAMKPTVIPAEGAKPLEKAFVYVYEAEKQLDGKRKSITSFRQGKVTKLAAGTYHIVGKIGSAQAGMDVDVTAGKLTEPVINLNAGALKVEASNKVWIKLLSADKNLDGSQDLIGRPKAGRALMLPAGNYVLNGVEGDKSIDIEVEIKAGKLSEVTLQP